MRRLAILLALSASAAAGPKENLPEDCVIVNSFDFAALRKTEVWGRIAKPIDEFLKEAAGLEGLFEGMGLEPERDLDSLTFALGGDVAKGDERVYAIARGRFDAKKLAEAFAQAGIKPVERGGMTVFESQELQGKRYCGFDGAFGVVDGALLFADPANGLDALHAATKEGAARGAIATVLEAAPEGHAWTVFLPTQALRDEMRKEPEGAPFAALKSAVLTYKVGPQIEVALNAEAESEDLAKQVGVVAQAGVMALGLKQRPKLECKGATLVGSLAIPLEDAMTIMGMPLDSPEKPGMSAQPVVAEGAPKIDGAGKLQRLALPGQVNGMEVSPDGRHTFVDRAQESDVVLDAELRVVGKIRDAHGRMGFALDGKSALWPDGPGGEATVLTIPDLRKTHEIERPPDRFDNVWAVCALPDGKSFVIAGWEEVRLFHMDPPRWGARGKASIGQPIAGALDPKTGMLVLMGDDRSFEVFDAAALKSVASVTLPCSISFDVVATGGRAWCATTDGTILPVDIESRRVLEPVRVGDGGHVKLAMSASGRTIAALARMQVDGDHYPTVLKVFLVEDGNLREVAKGGFVAPCAANGLVVLDDSKTVLFGGRESFVWRYEDSD